MCSCCDSRRGLLLHDVSLWQIALLIWRQQLSPWSFGSHYHGLRRLSWCDVSLLLSSLFYFYSSRLIVKLMKFPCWSLHYAILPCVVVTRTSTQQPTSTDRRLPFLAGWAASNSLVRMLDCFFKWHLRTKFDFICRLVSRGWLSPSSWCIKLENRRCLFETLHALIWQFVGVEFLFLGHLSSFLYLWRRPHVLFPVALAVTAGHITFWAVGDAKRYLFTILTDICITVAYNEATIYLN